MRSYLAVLAVALIPLASCGAGRRTDPELELVRAYLRENLDDPTWEEVRWWPARDLTERKRESIAELRDSLADAEKRLAKAQAEAAKPLPTIPDYPGPANVVDREAVPRARQRALEQARSDVDRYRESLKQAESAKPLRVCRLKYRSGGILRDDVFFVEGGRVKPAEVPGYPGYWKQYFE